MRLLIALLFTFITTLSHAQLLVVNVYQPLAGKASLTASYMQEAQSILRDMGYQANYSSDLAGIYRFNTYFESWESYGEFFQGLGSSPRWAAFMAKVSTSPSAMQIDNLLLNEVKAGPGVEPGMVIESTMWDVPLPERGAFMAAAMGSVPHHERQGAVGVSIWANAFNVYYSTHHENMRSFGRFRDTPNPEFGEYFRSQQNPNVSMERQTVLVTGQ